MAVIDASLEDPTFDFLPTAIAVQRRQGRVVTQIITRPFTTITAVVTLGDGSPTGDNSVPTTTAYSQPAAGNSAPASTNPGTSLSQEEIGAIIGSVIGFVIIVLLIWFCLSRRRQYLQEYTSESELSVVVQVPAGGRTRFRDPRDPWNRPGFRVQMRPGPTLVPPPVTIPPTPRQTNYRTTRYPQIRGVTRYP